MSRAFFRYLLVTTSVGIMLAALNAPAGGQSVNFNGRSPVDVVKAYLRAMHARDFDTAYGYVSARDRTVRGKGTYLRSHENFSGFALDLARRVATGMEVWAINQQLGSSKTHLEIGYRAPTADELASQLLEWDPAKLNALSIAQQSALLESVSKLQNTGRMITIEGREKFDLVREPEGWRIFFDWQAHHRVVFKSTLTDGQGLTVRFLRNDLFVKREEPFQVDLAVTNRTNRAIVIKLNHLFAPRQIEKNIDMIACGSLAPLHLQPHEIQKISSVYLLRGALSNEAPIGIIYDFNVTRPLDKRFARLKDQTMRQQWR